MSGDPPNIIIGTAFGYTFIDFVTNTGLIAWVGMIAALVFFFLIFRKPLSRRTDTSAPPERYPQPREAIASFPHFIANTAIFLIVIILLVTHAQTGLSVAAIGVIAALMTLAAAGVKAGHVARRLDWRTLLFFIGLFIVVGGLEETGILKMIADFIGDVSGGSLVLVMSIILWFSAILSAVVDNIPFAATMVPVIAELSASRGLSLPTLSWSLALGTDIGGNATPIGASANVVGTAISEREGYPVGWGRFIKYALPPMLIVIALCNILLLVRYT